MECYGGRKYIFIDCYTGGKLIFRECNGVRRYWEEGNGVVWRKESVKFIFEELYGKRS